MSIRRVFAAGCAALMVLLVACGEEPAEGPSQGATPLEAVAQASANLAEQGTARVAFRSSMELPQEQGGGTLISAGEGEVDLDRQLTHMTMEFSGDGGAAEQNAAAMGEMEMVGKGLVAYMRWPFMNRMAPQLKTEWIRMDLEELGKEMGLDLGQLTQYGQNDPAQTAQWLDGVSEVKEVGTEELRGVETTHYRGVVDFDKVPKELEELADQLQELMDIDQVPIEAWVDEEGVARKVFLEYDRLPMAGADGQPQTGKWTVEFEYYDFGTEVDIDIPSARETTDLMELMGRS